MMPERQTISNMDAKIFEEGNCLPKKGKVSTFENVLGN